MGRELSLSRRRKKRPKKKKKRERERGGEAEASSLRATTLPTLICQKKKKTGLLGVYISLERDFFCVRGRRIRTGISFFKPSGRGGSRAALGMCSTPTFTPTWRRNQMKIKGNVV